jgi:hypothetical protein
LTVFNVDNPCVIVVTTLWQIDEVFTKFAFGNSQVKAEGDKKPSTVSRSSFSEGIVITAVCDEAAIATPSQALTESVFRKL